jgi:hypothetical protein
LASGDRIVDVRSEHPGFAPEAQGAGRIERLRGPEGPGRLGVMEGPRVPVALIEIRLRVRLGRGGDGPGQLAEIIGKGRLLLGARRGRTARQITRRPRVRCAWPASAALAAELAPLCGRDRNAVRRWSTCRRRTRGLSCPPSGHAPTGCPAASSRAAAAVVPGRTTRFVARECRRDERTVVLLPLGGWSKPGWHRRDEWKHRGLGGEPLTGGSPDTARCTQHGDITSRPKLILVLPLRFEPPPQPTIGCCLDA